jgi:hypothetical protein
MQSNLHALCSANSSESDWFWAPLASVLDHTSDWSCLRRRPSPPGYPILRYAAGSRYTAQVWMQSSSHLRPPPLIACTLQPSSNFFAGSSNVGFSHTRPISDDDINAPSKCAPFRFAHLPDAGSLPNVAPADCTRFHRLCATRQRLHHSTELALAAGIRSSIQRSSTNNTPA